MTRPNFATRSTISSRTLRAVSASERRAAPSWSRRSIADGGQGEQAVRVGSAAQRPDRCDGLLAEFRGRQAHDMVQGNRAAICRRGILRRTMEVAPDHEWRPSGPRGSNVCLHRILRMRLPRAEQGRRIPNSEFRERSVIEVGREEPEHPVVFDKGGIDARDSWHEGRSLRPAMREVRGLVERNLPGVRDDAFVRSKIVLLEEDLRHASPDHAEWVGVVAPGLRWREPADVEHPLRLEEPGDRRIDDANVPVVVSERAVVLLLEKVPYPPEGAQGLGHAVGLSNDEGGYRPYAWDGHVPGQPEHTRCLPWRWDPCAS